MVDKDVVFLKRIRFLPFFFFFNGVQKMLEQISALGDN
jgi:hypothetical protein